MTSMVGEFQSSPICTKGLTDVLVVFRGAGKRVRGSQSLKQSKACRSPGKVPEMISHATEATVPRNKTECLISFCKDIFCQLASRPNRVKSNEALANEPSAGQSFSTQVGGET